MRAEQEPLKRDPKAVFKRHSKKICQVGAPIQRVFCIFLFDLFWWFYISICTLSGTYKGIEVYCSLYLYTSILYTLYLYTLYLYTLYLYTLYLYMYSIPLYSIASYTLLTYVFTVFTPLSQETFLYTKLLLILQAL